MRKCSVSVHPKTKSKGGKLGLLDDRKDLAGTYGCKSSLK